MFFSGSDVFLSPVREKQQKSFSSIDSFNVEKDSIENKENLEEIKENSDSPTAPQILRENNHQPIIIEDENKSPLKSNSETKINSSNFIEESTSVLSRISRLENNMQNIESSLHKIENLLTNTKIGQNIKQSNGE